MAPGVSIISDFPVSYWLAGIVLGSFAIEAESEFAKMVCARAHGVSDGIWLVHGRANNLF